MTIIQEVVLLFDFMCYYYKTNEHLEQKYLLMSSIH